MKVARVLERNGQVYTTVVPDVSAATLMAEIESKTEKGSVYYTDCFKSYKSLKQYGKHNKINKQFAYAKGHNHVNGLEGFWSFAKERFHKYDEFLERNSCTRRAPALRRITESKKTTTTYTSRKWSSDTTIETPTYLRRCSR